MMSADLLSYKVLNAPPTSFYISEYISREEEQYLLSKINSVPIPKWTQLSNRRLQNWGGIPHNKGMIAEVIPPWLTKHLDRIHTLDIMSSKKPNHVLVNEYLPGQGIMPHLDGSLFYPTITTISLGSHIVLKFLKSENSVGVSLLPLCSLLLEPRSLLILQDDLFFKYLHCIEEVTEDSIGKDIVNLGLCKGEYNEKRLQRQTRVSLTIRHVPKTSAFKVNTNRFFK